MSLAVVAGCCSGRAAAAAAAAQPFLCMCCVGLLYTLAEYIVKIGNEIFAKISKLQDNSQDLPMLKTKDLHFLIDLINSFFLNIEKEKI